MSETVVVFCRLCLAWLGPFIMPPSAHVCARDVRACVAALVCDKATIHVFACTLYACKCRCTCVCMCACSCGSTHLPSGHGFIKHFINVKHHLHRQIKLAHTHRQETHPHAQTTSGKTEVTRSQWDDKIRALPCKLHKTHISRASYLTRRVGFRVSACMHILVIVFAAPCVLCAMTQCFCVNEKREKKGR